MPSKRKKLLPTLEIPQPSTIGGSESLFSTPESDENEEIRAEESEVSNQNSRRAPKRSRWKDANLIFPANVIHRMIMNTKEIANVRREAAVYLTGVLQYLTMELFDITSLCTISNRKKRIIPRHIMLAVHHDEEYKELLKNVTFAQSGVTPHIESVLLPQIGINRKRKSQEPGQPGPSGLVKKKKLTPMPMPVSGDDDSD